MGCEKCILRVLAMYSGSWKHTLLLVFHNKKKKSSVYGWCVTEFHRERMYSS